MLRGREMKGEIVSDWMNDWMDGDIEGTSYMVTFTHKNNALRFRK